MSRAARRWRDLGAQRARTRAEQLDARLDDAPSGPVSPDAALAPEHRAALALASALAPPAGLSADELVGLRAGLAAHRTTTREIARRRVERSLRLGSAAALAFGVVMAVVSTSPEVPGTATVVEAAEDRATVVLADLSRKMDDVRDSVEEGDREKARSTSVAAAGALVRAQETAKLLPPGNAVRDKVLAEALDQIQTLQVLVTRLQLEVPPLVSSPLDSAPSSSTSAAAGPGSSTSVAAAAPVQQSAPAPAAVTTAPPTTAAASSTSSSSTTTSAPPSTTTTRLPVVLPTTTTLPPASSTTSTTALAATTTSTTALPSTTTTTTAPPPTTTTTSPPLPTTTTTTSPGPPPVTTTTAP